MARLDYDLLPKQDGEEASVASELPLHRRINTGDPVATTADLRMLTSMAQRIVAQKLANSSPIRRCQPSPRQSVGPKPRHRRCEP